MNDSKKVQELEEEIWDLKIRIKRLEEYIRDLPDPKHYISLRVDTPIDEDSQMFDVVLLVLKHNTCSPAFLQRKMSIGYSRAARIVDKLEDMGIVGPAHGTKPREVLLENAKAYLNTF